MSTDKMLTRQNVDHKMPNRQNVDRQNAEQTKCRTDKMLTDKMPNRQNVDNYYYYFFSIFFFLKFFYAEKQCGRQFWNAVEREPVETRVLNPSKLLLLFFSFF